MAADLADDVHEFIELKNSGAVPVVLTGWRLAGGVDFTFPAGATISAGGYAVVAKVPARVQAVYAGLTGVLGPWTGGLGNRGDTIQLRDAADAILDTVSYSARFPWPNMADGLGAGQDFTLTDPAPFQYKGCSLQRVSAAAPGNDPANWLASPVAGSPTPGAANATVLATPHPVVIAFGAAQAADDATIIRAAQAVRVTATFSGSVQPAAASVEYWVDDVHNFGEARTTVSMTLGGAGQWSATVPGQADRSIVRYRILADRSGVMTAVSPRADDAALVPTGATAREAWHAYFVTPAGRSAVLPYYDVLVSSADPTSGAFNGRNGLAAMNYNITGNPKRVTFSATSGLPRALPYVAATAQLWNGSVPCIFVNDGVVRDAHLRYHGSRYNRSAGRNSFKLRFSDTERLNGADSVFITDKGDYFSVAQGLLANAGFPMSQTRWISWQLNSNGVINRLEQGEYNGDLLDTYHERLAKQNPGTPKEASGEFYKSTGTIETGGEGPYGRGDLRALPAGAPWTALDRYKWTYTLQNHQWKGPKPIKDLTDGMWAARGDSGTAPSPTPNVAALRTYLDSVLDLDTELSTLSIINWMCPWDDTTQNHFFWRRASGKWSQTLWDMDALFGNGDTTGTNSWIYLGENGTPPAGILGNNFRGPNFFKDSFFKAYRTEYNERLWVLNNTYLHPDNLKQIYYRDAGGNQRTYYSFINGVKPGFCEARFASVNTQTGHAADGSDFTRPGKPVATAATGGATLLPPGQLAATAYSHSSGNTAGVNAHAKSKWEIRAASGTYLEPVVSATSTTSLTSFALPFDDLTFGTIYSWRVTYYDTQGRPSQLSDEASFAFGPPQVPSNTQTLVAIDAATQWKHNFTSAFNDDAWKQAAYDDSIAAWPSGAGPLGFETSNPPPGGLQAIRTALPAPNNATAGRMTIYFRKKFNFPGDPTNADIKIRHWIDDGAVFYINGQKIGQFNMAQTKTTYNFTDLAQASNECSEQFLTVAPADRLLFVNGENTLAIEVHQTPLAGNGVGSTSSDVILAVEVQVTFPPGAIPAGDVVINEVMADNRGAVFNGTSSPDWIELRNNTAGDIDLGGYGLTDDILTPLRYQFPAGTTIPASGRLVLWCDSDTAQPGLHTGFGLDQGGQRVVLTRGNAILDFVAFGPQAANLTLGRVPDGTGQPTLCTPSNAAENVAHTPRGAVVGVRINEWMARPATGEDWFELYNPSSDPVEISSLWLSDTPGTPQITRIPANSYLGGRGFADFVADGSNAGTNKVNFRLASGGENVILTQGATTLHNIAYGSQARGVSQGSLPDGTAGVISFATTPSRGYSNWIPASVVINEALANSAPPLEDFVELHNPTAAPVSIGGWWLSDDRLLRRKFQLAAGTSIAPGGYLLIPGSALAGGASPFSLSSTGDEIILSAVDGTSTETGQRAQVNFGASAVNVSFGRVLTSDAPEFWAQTARTPGGPNAAPVTQPVIINEIHYHPTDLAGGVDNTADEFVEMHNVTGSAISLAGWRLRGVSDFAFTTEVISAGGYVHVVGRAPTAAGEFGPFASRLPNDTGSVELARPGTAADGVPFVMVDKAEYSDAAPWANADGNGLSLQRQSRSVIGNDPGNWVAAAPTPFALNFGQTPLNLDSDGDSIPDAWELANGLNPASAADATSDTDADGQSARAEYLAGSDPRNAGSVFTWQQIFPGTDRFAVNVFPGRTLRFQSSADLVVWTTLEERPPGGTTGTVEFTDLNLPAPSRRYYRVTAAP